MKIYNFRYNPTLSKTVCILFWINLVLDAATAIHVTIFYLSDREDIYSYVSTAGVIGLAASLVSIALIITFLVWVHRMSSNAHSIGAQFMSITPGWAAGWYFIPFANLIKPYEAIKEIFDVLNIQIHKEAAHTRKTPSAFPTWWGFWISAGVISTVTEVFFEPASQDFYLIGSIVSSILSVCAAYFAIKVVKLLSEACAQIALEISRNPNAPPPVGTVHS